MLGVRVEGVHSVCLVCAWRVDSVLFNVSCYWFLRDNSNVSAESVDGNVANVNSIKQHRA